VPKPALCTNWEKDLLQPLSAPRRTDSGYPLWKMVTADIVDYQGIVCTWSGVTSLFAKPARSHEARPTDVIIKEQRPAKVSLMEKVSAET